MPSAVLGLPSAATASRAARAMPEAAVDGAHLVAAVRGVHRHAELGEHVARAGQRPGAHCREARGHHQHQRVAHRAATGSRTNPAISSASRSGWSSDENVRASSIHSRRAPAARSRARRLGVLGLEEAVLARPGDQRRLVELVQAVGRLVRVALVQAAHHLLDVAAHARVRRARGARTSPRPRGRSAAWPASRTRSAAAAGPGGASARAAPGTLRGCVAAGLK